LFTIGNSNQNIDVFLDLFSIQKGENFRSKFAKSLINSAVVVPILSAEALKGMIDHDSNAIDNVLLEWIIAIECYSNKKSSVKSIFPIASGSFDPKTNSFGDLFKEEILNKLSQSIPKSTLEKAKSLLFEHGIDEISVDFHDRSVQKIVATMCEYLCFCTWTIDNQEMIYIVAESCSHTINILNSLQNKKVLYSNQVLTNNSASITNDQKITHNLDNNNIIVQNISSNDDNNNDFQEWVKSFLKSKKVNNRNIDLLWNVLDDESIRSGIKVYSSWPTIPQLYVAGEFVGGSDIMIEMYQKGELAEMIEIANKMMEDPVRILVKKEELTLDGIRQFYISVQEENWKLDTLCDIYETLTINKCIIYCITKHNVEWIEKKMKD
jgi:glutaredoxin-related protein